MDSGSIFVSYSSKDRPFALGLVKELQNLGANVWIDQLCIGLGENWDDAIEEALEKSGTFMLILSPTSVESPNVLDEVSVAINTKKKMVPILIKECELPMRLQRRQYADLAHDPEKAISDILAFLGLQTKAASSLKKLLSLIGISEAPKKIVLKTKGETNGNEIESEVNAEDLLISEAEIDKAIFMHKKGIRNNWIVIAVVAIISVLVLAILTYNDLVAIPFWIVAVGSLSLNLLSVKPFGGIKRRQRFIDLMDLLKLKRERLTRIINKLSSTDIEKFNNEFYDYVKN